MKIFGQEYHPDLLRKLTSNPQQVVSCEQFRSIDGDMLDQRMIRIRNGELELEILADRGFDIARVLYRGIPIQWVSPAGFRHSHSFIPSSMEPDGWGWLRSWQGGFLSTIGIDHVGKPTKLPNRHLHPAVTAERRFTGGYISLSSASIEKIDVNWKLGEITVQANVRQAAPFAEHLVLTRTILMKIGEPGFILKDVVRNDGYIDEPVQILYHINLGWPFLAPGTTLETSCTDLLEKIDTVKPDDDPSIMPEPIPIDVERVWNWHAKPGLQFVKISNENTAGRGKLMMLLEWNGNELPHFVQWRNACESMYVQGLEPSTTGINGRDMDTSHAGAAPYIRPGESREFNLKFAFEGEV